MSTITKVCTFALMGTVLLLVGCGGSSTKNTTTLSSTQASQLTTETFTNVLDALENIEESDQSNSSRQSNPLAVLSKHRNPSSAVTSDGISCSGSTCTITSVVYDCTDGGTITTSGSESETSLSLTMTPSSCSDGTLVMNGNPDVTLNAKESDNGTTTTVSLSVGGDISFAPVTTGAFPTGSCGSDLSVNISVSDSTGSLTSCSISGSICGESVNISSCSK
jgi:hypothetical protein